MYQKITEKKPPFDRPVLVRGKSEGVVKYAKSEGVVKYAIAFNQCYPPHMALTQMVEVKNGTSYSDIPFDVEEWLELEF